MAHPSLPSLDRRGLGALLIALVTACASVQGRYVATPIDAAGQRAATRVTASGLVISGEELRQYSSAHFGLIEVTFENFSNEWVRVERIALDFGGPERDAGVLLPEGADLVAWHHATVNRNDIRDTNAEAALGALLALGAIVSVAGRASGKRELAAAGGALVLGAATAAAVREHAAGVDRAEHGRILTESHLLAVPFPVPPGLFAKKWVLINTRSPSTPCITSMLIDYDVEGGNERVLLELGRPSNLSEWQRYACAAAAHSSHTQGAAPVATAAPAHLSRPWPKRR